MQPIFVNIERTDRPLAATRYAIIQLSVPSIIFCARQSLSEIDLSLPRFHESTVSTLRPSFPDFPYFIDFFSPYHKVLHACLNLSWLFKHVSIAVDNDGFTSASASMTFCLKVECFYHLRCFPRRWRHSVGIQLPPRTGHGQIQELYAGTNERSQSQKQRSAMPI